MTWRIARTTGAARPSSHGTRRIASPRRGTPRGRTDRYVHDAAGNLLDKPGLGVPGAIDGEPDDLRVATGIAMASGNRLAYANGDRFDYDPQDHICLRERAGSAVEYVHDALGRLRKVLCDGELRWEADYDALGRRTAKRSYDKDGACARWAFYWDGDRLGAETLPDGRLRLYIHAEDGALVPMLALEYADADSDDKSARVFVLQPDHRGAVERVEDEGGQVVWEATVGPYGEVDVHLGWDFHQPFVLVGQYADPEIGLSYQRFRYWSPELGRFLQSDPLGLAGGLNVYAWPGCPLVTSDPLGLGCPKRGKGGGEPDETGPDQESLDLDRRDRAALAAHFDAVDAHEAKVPKEGGGGPCRRRHLRRTRPPRKSHRGTRGAVVRHVHEGRVRSGRQVRRGADGTRLLRRAGLRPGLGETRPAQRPQRNATGDQHR